MDRPELVAGTVPQEADDARPPRTPGIERQDRNESSFGGSAGVQQELSAVAEVRPPCVAPLRRCEDAAGLGGEALPLRPELLDGVHALDARYNISFPGSMPTVHAPLAKRITRLVARTLGVPLGVVSILLLRLTARKAGVALMYHSVQERAGDPGRELVPPHAASLFERQIRHVQRNYRIVSADRLLDAARARRRGERFPLAITFDDDLACHATVALPILHRVGVAATFFLSGASLERPFAFHYERLQRAFDSGRSDVDSIVLGSEAGVERRRIHELGLALEEMAPDDRDAAAARLADALGPDPPESGIRASQVRELAEAGMTIGFHTRRHDSLPWLDDERLRQALTEGRDELVAVAGRPVAIIGYPHGRADRRVADAAREAGYTAGFTTEHVAVTPSVDPLLQGRVGPSLRSVGALAIELALTLLKSGSARPTPARGRSA
jgi:peptidoglycan/xylan/chitin deacetylase (PgdA/CDA1 family)